MTQSSDLRSPGRGSFRLSLRIARRDASTHRARSILIVLLIAIPIIGLSALATIETSNQPTTQERLRNTLGSNQAELMVAAAPGSHLRQDPTDPGDFQVDDSTTQTGPPTQLPSDYLPAGTRILSLRQLAVIARTATGIGSFTAIQGEPWDRAFRGRFAVFSGRSPTRSDEVMVTPATLARLGKTVGQTFSITQPKRMTLTIVGTMRDLAEPDTVSQVFARVGALDNITPAQDPSETNFYLPSRAISWPEVQRLNENGIVVLSRSVVLAPPPTKTAADAAVGVQGVLQTLGLLLPVVAFTLFEVALLAGAAFTVGTKQQQRSLATLASVGGDRRMLARVVSAAGIVLGLIGGIVGSIVGIGIAWAYLQLSSHGSISAFPGLHINPLIVAGIILFAVLAGWISALVPARRAARIDVVASLRGAARPETPSKRAPILAVIVAVVGLAITVVGATLLIGRSATGGTNLTLDEISITLIVIGPIVLQIAALVIAPSILRVVARAFSRLGTAARLASRDTARNSSRSVPAVGAIMSTIFVASFIITYIAAVQASETAEYEYRTSPGVVSAQYALARPTLARQEQLVNSMKAILHTTRISILDSAFKTPTDFNDPSAKPNATQLFALPALDPAVRCTQLPAGPLAIKPGSLSITSPDCQGPQYLTDPVDDAHIWVATPAQIARAIGTPLTASSKAALAAGEVVAFYPEYVRNGEVTINWWTEKQLQKLTNPGGPGPASKSKSLAAVVQKPPHESQFDMVMSPSTARSIGLHFAPTQIVAKVASAPTEAQFDALNASGQAISRSSSSVSPGQTIDSSRTTVYFNYEGGPSTFAGTAEWALLALSAIITLAAAAVAIGLARSEGRRDEAILGSLGAPPRLRRSFSFWSAIVITGVGAIGGVILGAIPAMAVSEALVQPGGRAAVPFSPPWLVLGLAAIGLPLVIAVGSWLTAGRARVQYNVRAPIE